MVVEVEITAPAMVIPILSTPSLLAAQLKVAKNPGIWKSVPQHWQQLTAAGNHMTEKWYGLFVLRHIIIRIMFMWCLV